LLPDVREADGAQFQYRLISDASRQYLDFIEPTEYEARIDPAASKCGPASSSSGMLPNGAESQSAYAGDPSGISQTVKQRPEWSQVLDSDNLTSDFDSLEGDDSDNLDVSEPVRPLQPTAGHASKRSAPVDQNDNQSACISVGSSSLDPRTRYPGLESSVGGSVVQGTVSQSDDGVTDFGTAVDEQDLAGDIDALSIATDNEAIPEQIPKCAREELAIRFAAEVGDVFGDAKTLQLALDTLPIILREYSIRLRSKAENIVERAGSVFVRHYRELVFAPHSRDV
jgi:hypothetical protein